MALKTLITLAAAAGLMLGLAACDEAEQGRILRYEKGSYLGPTDTELTDAQREELRARLRLQGG